MQWIKFTFHPAFSIHMHKLAYWLFQCNFNVNHWLNHLCSHKWFNFSFDYGTAQTLAAPYTTWRLLTSEVVLACSVCHKPVGREVYQHQTKLSCIFVLNSQAKSKVTLAPSAIITHGSRFFWGPLWRHFNVRKWLCGLISQKFTIIILLKMLLCALHDQINISKQ